MPLAAEVRPAVSFATLAARVRAAVEGVASTDPNPVDPFRGLYVSDDLAVSLARAEPELELDDRLAGAARLLGLSEVETAVLAVCAAPELSPRYGRLYAYLHDDVTRKLASPTLAARLLAEDGFSAAAVLGCFGHDGALLRRGAVRLLDAGGPTPLAEKLVKLADVLSAHLLGGSAGAPARDPRLRSLPAPEHDPGRAASIAELRGLLERESPIPVVVAGPDAPSLVASALRRPLLLVAAADAVDTDLLREAEITAAIEGRQLCFDALDDLHPESRGRLRDVLGARGERPLLCAASPDAVVALGDRTALVVEAPMPSFAERRTAWAALAGVDEVGDVAAKFRLSVEQIAEGAEVARLVAAARGEPAPGPADLDRGARQASTSRLAELATRLKPAFEWSQLVLPERQLEVLTSISAYLRHRDLVLSEWGYERTVARNQGLKALFAGESGTGKTMAGQVLARELGLDLYRIDLATVVSKYIGETEKNLDRIFDAAEGSNAILFFDEADALFGKRSEVKDAHDRYANIEVAYLLQKMEGYPGAVILATNFRQNMDDAFLRRLDVVVDFPFPEPPDRERIWRLVIPDSAPLADDVDIEFLANQFKLSGGAIRNCSLGAAFLAADEGEPIGMRHLVRAVALEYVKHGRLTLEADFERFHELIRTGNGKG